MLVCACCFVASDGNELVVVAKMALAEATPMHTRRWKVWENCCLSWKIWLIWSLTQGRGKMDEGIYTRWLNCRNSKHWLRLIRTWIKLVVLFLCSAAVARLFLFSHTFNLFAFNLCFLKKAGVRFQNSLTSSNVTTTSSPSPICFDEGYRFGASTVVQPPLHDWLHTHTHIPIQLVAHLHNKPLFS